MIYYRSAPCALCGHHFPGNYRHFPSPRRVRAVVNLGGVVKTLRRSNSQFLLSPVVFLVRKGPLGVSGDNVNLKTAMWRQRFVSQHLDPPRGHQCFVSQHFDPSHKPPAGKIVGNMQETFVVRRPPTIYHTHRKFPILKWYFRGGGVRIVRT